MFISVTNIFDIHDRFEFNFCRISNMNSYRYPYIGDLYMIHIGIYYRKSHMQRIVFLVKCEQGRSYGASKIVTRLHV